jgi:hypothetical protein
MTEMALLVLSCDKYCDLWNPFFTLLFRYWPDCPYPVYLASNFRTYSDKRVKTITVGKDKDWSSNLGIALQQMPYSHLILLLEDYLLTEPVDTARIRNLVAYMKRKRAGCLRLFSCPGPDVPCTDNLEVGEILKGSGYRLSLQAAIWDKQILLGLLREGETPWELEVKGSRRTDELSVPFLSITKGVRPAVSYFCTAVVRGKWLRDAVDLCREEGIRIDLQVRECEPWHSYVRRVVMPKFKEKTASMIQRVSGGG